jgi:DNA-binding NarL/FixJ family response regulator
MTEFTYPKRERNSKRPYKLTRPQVELLQRLADGEMYKEMATPTRDSRCIWHMAWRIRAQMGATTAANAVAIALREGIIK